MLFINQTGNGDPPPKKQPGEPLDTNPPTDAPADDTAGKDKK